MRTDATVAGTVAFSRPAPEPWRCRNLSYFVLPSASSSTSTLGLCPRRRFISLLSSSAPPRKYAVLGAGFAGLSVVWHLLQLLPKEAHCSIDIYDEVGIGGGASGISGGLLHPYSPKGKLLWMGAECWNESQNLLCVAEAANEKRRRLLGMDSSEAFIWRRGILRPATSVKNVDLLKENAQHSLESCRIEHVDLDAGRHLIPNLCLPFNSAVYMPFAVNVHAKRYLEALFLACQYLSEDYSESGYHGRDLKIFHRTIDNLLQLSDEYNAVIICVGAKAVMLPELVGKLPLRTCRGVVARMQLPTDTSGEYPDLSPSILADAWLAVQGARQMVIGSTWNWGSKNACSSVSTEEASAAVEELTAKASIVYPRISNWLFSEANAGLRAMPPLTPLGSLPILGCVNDMIDESSKCKYWLLGGLGARGLLYHGWLGKLMAKAVISGNDQTLPSQLTSWKN